MSMCESMCIYLIDLMHIVPTRLKSVESSTFYSDLTVRQA